MPRLVKLFFDPEHEHKRLRPRHKHDGRVDHYDLGYVQNVVIDQVVAEFKDYSEEEARDLDPACHLGRDALPVGPNTRVNPANQNQLLATINGRILLENNMVTVSDTLTIPGDINFTTGNILFLGDLVVEGSIRAGFDVQARNILVKGQIEGAVVTAQETIQTKMGLKGQNKALLTAGKAIKLGFCEHAKVVTPGDVAINGVCWNSHIYAGKKVIVLDAVKGGVICCRESVFVKNQLDGGRGQDSRILLGYDPNLLLKLEEVENAIRLLQAKLKDFKAATQQGREHLKEFSAKMELAKKKLAALARQRDTLRCNLDNTCAAEASRLLVPGDVMPGVDIAFGDAELRIIDKLHDVRFHLQDGKVAAETGALPPY